MILWVWKNLKKRFLKPNRKEQENQSLRRVYSVFSHVAAEAFGEGGLFTIDYSLLTIHEMRFPQ